MGKQLTQEGFLAKAYAQNEHLRNGELEIRGQYTRTSDRIECYCNKHDVLWNPIAASIYKGIGCRECAKDGISEKKSKSHEEFVADMAISHAGIKVLTKYIGMYDNITVELRCGHVWTTKAVYVYYRDFECPYCTGNAILVGFNDLWTTSPQTAILLTNPEDGYIVTKGSGQKKNFTCPECGKIQAKFVKNVVARGLQCSVCGDGVSYPNKFGRAFLDQVIGDNYIPEYMAEWCSPYKYDNWFYHNGKEYFLEMDGWFHYRDSDMSQVPLEERRRIDKLKDELAQEHGIRVIRINCIESSCDYIAKNIISSELNDMFDLSVVDWQRCNMQAQKNFVKFACDLYVSGMISTTEIAKQLKVARSTIVKYLKVGSEFGWCDYDPKKSNVGKQHKSKWKPIVAIRIQDGKECNFESVSACEKQMFDTCAVTVNRSSLIKALKSGDPYKGFIFKYTNSIMQN